MAITSSQVSVTTGTPTALTVSDGDGESVAIQNLGAAAIFLGDSTVTTTTGFQVAAAQTLTLDLAGGEIIYAVAASGTQAVHILRTRV